MTRRALATQTGFSLVELMIAMTLGLIITGAILQTFISNTQSSELQRTATELQEEGRATVNYLTRYARMAGFQETNLEGGNLSDGLTGDAASLTSKFKAGASSATASTDNPKPIVFLRDCLGNAVSNSAESINTFEKVGDELICEATTAGVTASAALISNVKEIRIQYGVDTDDDGIANRYLAAPGGNDVVLLKICLRLQSDNDLVNPAVTYLKCDGSNETTASSRLERRIETTVALRNRMGS